MTDDEFWALILAGSGAEQREEALRDSLTGLSADQLVAFQTHFDRRFTQSERWDLWGAAYLIGGGCSDDGFVDFRYGLISMGRDIFENALTNPDSLADVGIEEAADISNESYGYVCQDVHEELTGNAIACRRVTNEHDMGQEWDFDDPELNKLHLPRLVQMYG